MTIQIKTIEKYFCGLLILTLYLIATFKTAIIKILPSEYAQTKKHHMKNTWRTISYRKQCILKNLIYLTFIYCIFRCFKYIYIPSLSNFVKHITLLLCTVKAFRRQTKNMQETQLFVTLRQSFNSSHSYPLIRKSQRLCLLSINTKEKVLLISIKKRVLSNISLNPFISKK